MIMNTSSDTKDCIKSVKSICRYHFLDEDRLRSFLNSPGQNT